MRRRSLLAVCFAAVAGLMALPACQPATRHYQYVVSQLKPTALRIYDIDDGHRLVRTVPLPQLEGDIAGMGASAVTDRLYISSVGDGEAGVLLAYDLRTDRVLWIRTYPPEVDSLCVTPDGAKIYLSAGEHTENDYFHVLDASDGDVTGSVTVAPQTHNAVCNLDSTRAYLSSVRSPYVTIADTTDDHVIRRVGPFGDSVRPFTINGRNTLLIVNVNHLIGFEVGDIETGRKLWRVADARVPRQRHAAQPEPRRRSHPRRAGGLGGRLAEQEAARVRRDRPPRHRSPRRSPPSRSTKNPYWITFSLDGRYAYPATGDVIDTTTRKKVATIVDRSTKQVQVDVRGRDIVRVGSRHGIGYVTG